MSYELSFSPEFFLAEGEPYDRSDLALNKDGKPISVYSALCMMKENEPEEWKEMAIGVFGMDPEYASHLNPESVLDKIRETNTCRNLTVPVEVYIDERGNYTVLVWDEC